MWAVVLLYLWIKLSVYFVGEKLNIAEDTLYVPNMTWEVNYDDERKNLINKHDVADFVAEKVVDTLSDLDGEQNEFLMKFQHMCLSNISLCAKIKFQWDYSAKDKYMYLATSIYVLRHIDSNIQFGKPVKTQLKKITINNDIWTRRWFANWDTVTINLWSVAGYTEFLELLAHEMGHIVDLGMIIGHSRYKSSVYTEFGMSVFEIDDPSIDYYKLSWQSEKIRDSNSKKEDFCSGYGMTDPFEDFAECHNLYLNHNAVFSYWAEKSELMRQKYNFMANMYWWKYMFDSTNDLTRAKLNSSWRPWDTTKM